MPEITVIAHNIRSTHNVGSIFRSADGFGVKQLILTGYTPYPQLPDGDPRLPHLASKLSRQIHKTALGAEVTVPFKYYEDPLTWLEKNKHTDKIRVVGLEQATGSIRLSDYQPPEELAIFLGEEVHGISPELLEWCDDIVEIPMRGQKESFNVAVATGITLYALSLT